MLSSVSEFEDKVCVQDTTETITQPVVYSHRSYSNDAETALECLNHLASWRADEYQAWVEVGMALQSAGCSCQDWDNWSRSSRKYEAGDCQRKWKSFKREAGRCITVASLVEWARTDSPSFELHSKKTKKKRKHQQQQAVYKDPDTWGMIIPFSEHNLPTFPVNVLPEKLKEYITQVSESLQIPVDMPAMLSLAVCSYCVSEYRISPKPDWIEPLNLYVAIIMPPASKKSAVLKHITEPLKKYEQRLIEDCSQAVTKNQSERRVLESKQKKLETKLAKGDDINLRMELNKINEEIAEFKDIYMPTVITADSTTEAISRLLFENNGKLAVLNAEGGLFGIMGGKYNGGNPNLDVFLQGHAGDSLKVHRMGRQGEYVEHPCLVIGLAMQPAILENLKHKEFMHECGLFARFLYASPENDHGKHGFDTTPILEASKAYYDNLINDLLNNTPSTTLTLEYDAQEEFASYFESVEKRLNEDLYSIQSWAGKLRGAVLRIAGILQLIENPHSQTVSGKILKAAINIGEYLIVHAKAVFERMDFDKELHLASRILNWISRKGKTEFSQNEVYQSLKTSGARTMNDFIVALERLEEHNYINHVLEQTRGRPSSMYKVNPELLEI